MKASLNYGANVKGETIPDCSANEGEEPSSESLSVYRRRAERDTVRRQLVSYLISILSRVNHKGLHQG